MRTITPSLEKMEGRVPEHLIGQVGENGKKPQKLKSAKVGGLVSDMTTRLEVEGEEGEKRREGEIECVKNLLRTKKKEISTLRSRPAY